MVSIFKHFQVARHDRVLTRIIILACVMTLLTMGLGATAALYKNWEIRLKTSKVHLIQGSVLVNLLLENALTDAAKSLNYTKHEIEKELLKNQISSKQAYVILMQSLGSFTKYNRSDLLGVIFLTDAQGQMIARSGEYSEQAFNVADRFYYQDLLKHPHKRRTIGPMLISRTNNQWAFHMSVPIYDGNGQFAGVLVRQLMEKDIVKELEKYITPTDFSQIFTQYNGSSVSFIYPAPQNIDHLTAGPPNDWSTHLDQLKQNEMTGSWISNPIESNSSILVGFAKSPVYGLYTFATLPIIDLIVFFFWENIYIFTYVVIGLLFTMVFFYQIYKMSIDLTFAQDEALHDPLTKLHNRRALDEKLPLLLRDSMRSQQPVSVLFIDIDFFRLFNENHGHETGDLALIEVAQSLASCCRRPMDLICRWGGEEFVAVLPRSNQAAAEKMAIDMLQAVRRIRLSLPSGGLSYITVSIGTVTTTVSSQNLLDDLIDMSDKAMQHAKLTGRNRHSVFQRVLLQPTHSKVKQLIKTS